MQQRPELPPLDLDALPDSVRKAVAAAQREAADAAQREAADAAQREAGATAQARPAPPAPAGPGNVPAGRPRFDDRTMLEVEAIRRRQLREAFMRGQPGPYAGGPRAGLGLWGGLAIAIALALAIGLVALIQGTIEQQGKQHAALPPANAVQLARPPP
jgi:hypothetical protein